MLGVVLLVAFVVVVVAAWIRYAVASPKRRAEIDEQRRLHGVAMTAQEPGSARTASSGSPGASSSVGEDDAYRPGA